MTSKFTDFILRLAEDATFLAEFSERPAEVARAAGLSAAEQAILANPTPAVLSQAILNEISRDDDGDATTVIVITYTYTRVKETTLLPESSKELISRLRRLSTLYRSTE